MPPVREVTLPDGTKRQLHTGALKSPRYKLAAAMPFQPLRTLLASTPRPIVVPSFLEMWLNDTYGDCVTAEEAAAIAFYSVMLGLPEIKITDATVKTFCQKYDFLNGANLTDVMDRMISDGFVQDAGYKDGKYLSVDWSNETVLQAALEQGPVKIAIDHSALPDGAGSGSGWYAFGGSPGQYGNTDHCIAVWNYGTTAALFAALNTPVPAGAPANGYHIYTWAGVGVVDHAWLMSTVSEAWLRNPTSVSFGPAPAPQPPPPVPIPPTPAPGPTPTPIPSILQILKDLLAWFESLFGGGASRQQAEQLQALLARQGIVIGKAGATPWQYLLWILANLTAIETIIGEVGTDPTKALTDLVALFNTLPAELRRQ